MKAASPWHQRDYDVFDEGRYHHYLEIHRLTLSWLSPKKRESYELPRFNLPSLSIPDLPVSQRLTELLEEQNAAHKLDELEKKSWSIQKQVVNAFYKLTPTKDIPHLESYLKLTAWIHGKTCSQNRWGNDHPASVDLRNVYQVLLGTPFFHEREKHNHLVLRSTQDELTIELLNSHYYTQDPFKQNLFPYHFYWIKGFLYSFYTKLKSNYQIGSLNRYRLNFNL